MQPTEAVQRQAPGAVKTQQLDECLRTAQEQCCLLRNQYQQLQEDFRLNLDVLEERDQQLFRYDHLTSGVSWQQVEKKCDLQHKIQEPCGPLRRETEASEELELGTTIVEDQRFQKCMDPNQEEQLQEAHRAMAKLQNDLDTLSAQACSIKRQQEEHLQEREKMKERYRKQLSASLGREKHLEQNVLQMELEWQKNCEDIRSRLYLEQEQLIQELSQAREKANAEVVEIKEQLQDLTLLLQCVRQERDQALQGCFPGPGSLASEELAGLQQQNSRLQAVVSQMRREMVELSQTSPPLHHHLTSNGDKRLKNTLKKEDSQSLDPHFTIEKKKQMVKVSSSCACGHVQRVSQLYSRLKQAVSCIAALNRDRQLLIELCNRQRAQSSHKPEHLKTPEDTSQKQEQCVSVEQELTTQTLPQSDPGSVSCLRLSEDSLPSLTELWAQLDQASSENTVLGLKQEDPYEQQRCGAGQMEVCGVSASVYTQVRDKPPLKIFSKEQPKNTGRFTTAKIRNYNLKD